MSDKEVDDLLNVIDNIVIVPSAPAVNTELEREVETLEQQALKLRFMEELSEAAEKNNKELNLPKKKQRS